MGYGHTREDASLWNIYFSQPFQSLSTWSPLLTSLAIDRSVSHSWSGCLEIFRRYGSDYLVIGNSEVYRNFVPASFQYHLQDKNAPPLRVLNCTRFSAIGEVLGRAVHAVAGSRPKTHAVLWGYSHWNAFHRSPIMDISRKNGFGEIAGYTQDLHSLDTRSLFPKLDWADLLPLSLQNLSDIAHGKAFEEPMPDLNTHSESSKLTKERIQSMLQIDDYNQFLDGITVKDCDLTAASKEIDRTLQQIFEVTDHVYIYLTPVTPLARRGAPSCFLPKLQQLLQSKSGPRVSVLAKDWDFYGLDYPDFVYHTQNDLHRTFEQNHTNYQGALKVTEKLAAWVASEEESLK